MIKLENKNSSIGKNTFYAREAIPLTIILALLLIISSSRVWSNIIVPRFREWNSSYTRCWMDYVQNFSMVHTLLKGGNPYLPVVDLFNKIAPQVVCRDEPVMLLQPSPHAPASMLLLMPFVSVSSTLDQSALLWSSFSLSLLLLSIWRTVAVYKFSFVQRVLFSVLFFLFALGTRAIYQDLWLSNLQTFILALVLELILALRRGEQRGAGILLGILLSIKLLGLPLLVYLAYARRFKLLFYAIASTIALTAAVALFFGFDKIVLYPEAVRQTYALFGHQSTNLSLTLIAHRLFGSLSATPDAVDMFGIVQHVALFGSLLSVQVNDWLGAMAVILLVFFCVTRKRKLEISVSINIALSALVQPIVWYYTHSVAIPAAFCLYLLIRDDAVPLWQRLFSWVAIFSLAVPPSSWLPELSSQALTADTSSALYLFDSLTVLFLIVMLTIVSSPAEE